VNVVSLSLCYPSDDQPQAGLFVRHRLRSLTGFANVRVAHVVPTPFWRRPFSTFQTPESCPPTWRVAMPYLPLVGKPLNPLLYARAVGPLIESWSRRGEVDVIDAHFCWPDGVAASKVASRLGLPYVVTLRGVLGRYAHDPIKCASVVRSLEGASAVIAVSQSLKDAAAGLGVSPHRIHVVPNGVDSEVFHPGDRHAARKSLGRPPDEVMLITVGHLCRRKGVHRVLELLPELLDQHDRLRYVVVGANAAEDRFADHLRRLTGKLGLSRYVSFTGALNDHEVARWLQAADLFVLPTTNEGWCNALSEAVATNLPVVCTDVGGNREVVANTNAALVPPNDARSLRETLRRFLDSPGRLNANAGRTMQRAWSRVGAETADVLHAAITASCPASATLA